jgi:8-oxo-dGTP pyrophosphatase MutT (NUDIX family)
MSSILVRILLEKGADYLFLKKSHEYSSKFPGMWELPGGKRKTNENPLTTANRELYEETGLLLPKLFLFYKSDDDVFDKVFYYYGKLSKYKPLKLSNEHTDYDFFNMKKILAQQNIVYKNAFFQAKKNLDYFMLYKFV